MIQIQETGQHECPHFPKTQLESETLSLRELVSLLKIMAECGETPGRKLVLKATILWLEGA